MSQGVTRIFPLLVDLSDLPASFWNTVANGGGDIRVFEDQAGGLVEVPREVVSCVTTGGANTGELWVKIPLLTATSDCVLQIHADGTSDYSTTATYGRNEVWSAESRVFHLKEESGSTAIDSTGNGNGTYGGGARLLIDGNQNFDGGGTVVDTNLPFPSISSSFSIRVAFSSDNVTTAGVIVGSDDSSNRNFWLYQSSTRPRVIHWDSAGTYTNTLANNESSDVQLVVDTYYWVSLTFDGTTGFLYLDGNETDSNAVSFQNDTLDIYIGDRRSSNSNRFDGQIAHVFIGPYRDNNWITTEYANQSDPGTFYAATDPSAGGGGIVPNAVVQSVTIDGVTLTIGGTTISAFDVDQDQSLGIPTLSQGFDLSPDAVDHTQSVDEPGILQANSIPVQDIDNLQSVT
jgi:hypothetical protein